MSAKREASDYDFLNPAALLPNININSACANSASLVGRSAVCEIGYAREYYIDSTLLSAKMRLGFREPKIARQKPLTQKPSLGEGDSFFYFFYRENLSMSSHL